MVQGFKIGSTHVHEEGGQGRKCAVTNDVYQVDKWAWEKRGFTISELSDSFPAIRGVSVIEVKWTGEAFYDENIKKVVSSRDKCLKPR